MNMNRKYYILLLISAAMLLLSCQKDPLADVNSGDWNHERNIIGITFKGQVGKAIISRDGDQASIEFTYNPSVSDDYSAIEIAKLELSYGATASISTGETLNFENPNQQAVITVTPANGEPLDWVITLVTFSESLLGEWNVSKLIVFGGTGPEYGGAAVIPMTDKPWCWDASTGPATEEDNTFTFTLTDVTDEGNPYGVFVNNAGTDGKYADFVFVNNDPHIDVNGFYRKIPMGEGSWLRDYAAGTVTFTFADNSTTVATLRLAGTYDLGWDKTKTVSDTSFEFALSGTDDWNAIYSDFDKFVKRPRKYWIDLVRSK